MFSLESSLEVDNCRRKDFILFERVPIEVTDDRTDLSDPEFKHRVGREKVNVCKASEDVGLGARVIVLLGFYQGGVRDGGHFVTVAGANSTAHQLLLSNPIRDDFEAGRTLGRSPAWHPYPHSSTVHNNASLVSHNAYTIRYNSIVGCWFLEGYFDHQTWEARIEYDVITSPYELLPDIA